MLRVCVLFRALRCGKVTVNTQSSTATAAINVLNALCTLVTRIAKAKHSFAVSFGTAMFFCLKGFTIVLCMHTRGTSNSRTCAAGCSSRDGPDRETIHVGHHQQDDHDRQRVQCDPHNAQHGGGRDPVQQHRHHGKKPLAHKTAVACRAKAAAANSRKRAPEVLRVWEVQQWYEKYIVNGEFWDYFVGIAWKTIFFPERR